MKSDFNNNVMGDLASTLRQVEYLDYSELVSFSSSNEANKAIKNIKTYLIDINADWFCQFDSINDLRRMNKYHPKLFLELFTEIVSDFVKLVVSLRSNIAKLALILLTEFFGNQLYFIKNFASEDNNGNYNSVGNGNNNNNNNDINDYKNSNRNNFNSEENFYNDNNSYNNKKKFINSTPNSHFVSNNNRISDFPLISNAKNNNTNFNSNFTSNRHTDFNKNTNRLSDLSSNANFTPNKSSNNTNNNNNNNNNNSDSFDFSAAQNTINSLFDTVLPYILQQSCTMKTFLKDEAKKCLETISSCTQSFYFLKKITLQINNKNANYVENAFLSAQALMQSLLSDADLFDSQNPSSKSIQSVKDLIQVNIGLYNLKKDLYAKKAAKLMSLLKELVGVECFESVKGCFDNVAKAVVDNMIKEGNKAAAKSSSNFKEFINSKK